MPYTPFLADIGKQIGGAMMQKGQQDLIQNAYMGAPGALEQLYGVNPQAAEQIKQSKIKEEQRGLATQKTKADAMSKLQKVKADVQKQIANFDTFEQAKAYYDKQVQENQELINLAGITPDQLELTPEGFQQIKKIYESENLQPSPELQQAIKEGKIKPESLNSKTIGFLNTLAKNGALTGESKTVNKDLIEAVSKGTIDPSKINSRTIQIWNDLASANVNATKSSADIKGKTEAYKDAIKYAGNTARVVHILDKNMPLLYDLADKVNKSGVPIVDSGFTRVQAKTTNDPDVIKYVNTLKTLRAEYANMLAKGAQVTESMRHDATQAIPSGLSSEGYRALGEQLGLEAKNIIDASNEVADSIQFGVPGKTMEFKEDSNTVIINGKKYSKPDGMTDQQWSEYKQSQGLQ